MPSIKTDPLMREMQRQGLATKRRRSRRHRLAIIGLAVFLASNLALTYAAVMKTRERDMEHVMEALRGDRIQEDSRPLAIRAGRRAVRLLESLREAAEYHLCAETRWEARNQLRQIAERGLIDDDGDNHSNARPGKARRDSDN